MELMLGNLLFSLVVKVGGTAIGLAVILWLASLWARKHLKKKQMRTFRWSALMLWITVTVLMSLAVLHNNSPRITVEDRRAPAGNPYQAGEVRDLNPNTKTDDERVQENRALIGENAPD